MFFPGVIKSELARNMNLLMIILMKLAAFFLKNTTQGAQSSLHCALQDGIKPLSGL